MTRVLAANYDKAPEDMVKRMHKTIDAFDAEDNKVVELEKKIDKLLETDGPESKKLAKAQEELAEAKVKRAELFAQLDKVTGELKLRAKPLPEKAGATKSAQTEKSAGAATPAKS
jgi:Tfp pilus assembly protein FimV